MNERVVPKMTNFCVVKLSNSPAISCVPRLELDHFESQPDSPRINQRFPSMNAIPVRLVNFNFGGYLTIRRLHLDAEGQEYREIDLLDGHGIRIPRGYSIQALFLQ